MRVRLILLIAAIVTATVLLITGDVLVLGDDARTFSLWRRIRGDRSQSRVSESKQVVVEHKTEKKAVILSPIIDTRSTDLRQTLDDRDDVLIPLAFRSDKSAEPSAEAAAMLAKLARKGSNRRFHLHAESTSRLAQARVELIKKQLIAIGVEPSRINVSVHDESDGQISDSNAVFLIMNTSFGDAPTASPPRD